MKRCPAPRFDNPARPVLVVVSAACLTLGGRCQTRPADYLQELAAARTEVIQTDMLTIRDLDLSAAKRGKNPFKAIVKNKTASTLTLGLDLRAVPGLWFLNWQQQFQFALRPKEEKAIEAEYQFDHIAQETWLRVRFSLLSVAQGNAPWPPPFFEKKYYLGKANPAADGDRFATRSTDHFRIYYLPSSLAARDIESIARERESAYNKISGMLQVTYPQAILLCLYPDGETKTRDTGHTGAGLSRDNIMVEIYNEETKLDPYHELTHTLASRLGNPPAVFSEGLAVHVAESMGADALKDLGSPGMKADEAVVAHRQDAKFIPLAALFTFTDIGPDESQPPVSYPEAASFVGYLIRKYGMEKFRLAYQSLVNDSDSAVIAKNRQTFQSIYGVLPAGMEQPWLSSLAPGSR